MEEHKQRVDENKPEIENKQMDKKQKRKRKKLRDENFLKIHARRLGVMLRSRVLRRVLSIRPFLPVGPVRTAEPRAEALRDGSPRERANIRR